MTFSIRATIRALVAPKHRIRCSKTLWSNVTLELDRRGERSHEAGVFLLGVIQQGRREVIEAIFYDDLDPTAYSTGVCVLTAPAFARLWSYCRERKLTVVADIHTHGAVAIQSDSDRTNPMVARVGHIAIIIPNFAAAPVPYRQLGIYEYQGSHRWIDLSPRIASGFFYIGHWS